MESLDRSPKCLSISNAGKFVLSDTIGTKRNMGP